MFLLATIGTWALLCIKCILSGALYKLKKPTFLYNFWNLLSCFSTNWKNPPFSTISGTCYHVSLQFLKLALIFSTKLISVRFWEVDFTGKYFSTISGTCLHILYNFWNMVSCSLWFQSLYNFVFYLSKLSFHNERIFCPLLSLKPIHSKINRFSFFLTRMIYIL